MKLNKQTVTACMALFALMGSVANTEAAEGLPSSFDLRDVNGHNYLSPVQNQGSLGACYAFGAAAAAESSYNIAMGLYDENAANFSESYIIWYLGQFYDGFDSTGANYDYDELQAIVDHGIISDVDFPYVTEDPGEGNYHTDAEKYTFSSWHRVAAFDVQTMKNVIQNIGALDVAVYVTDNFQYYSAGDEAFDEFMSANGIIDYRSTTNHAVAVVGWDDSEGTNGTWILRNSWSEAWGNNGYMNISYNSSQVSTSAAYMVYGDWIGEDFAIVNGIDIISGGEFAMGVYDLNGIYEWGGNNASIINNADIVIGQSADNGDAVSKGITLWAGENASLINNGDITVECVAYNGIGTAYGLMAQGHSMVNTGKVEVSAHGTDQANAYAARFLAYDNTGTFENSGDLYAYTTYGKAYGAYIDNAATVTNTGSVEAEGYYYAMGMAINNVGEVVNDGTIIASSSLGYTITTYIDACDSFTNNGTITATSENGQAYAVYAQDANIINTGTITATSEDAWGEGIALDTGTLLNTGTITGDYNEFENAVVVNNGTITSTNMTSLNDSTLQGSGSYIGDIESSNTIVSPGNSIGTITVDGNAEFTDGITLNLELINGEIDKIVVTGSLYVDGDATISVSASGYVPEGNYSFVQAAEISYSDDTTYAFENIEVPLMYEDSTMTYDNEAVSFVVNRHSYNDFVTNSDVVSNMAETLDKVRITAEGNLANLLTSIDYMETSAEIASAVSEFFPAINYTTGYAAMQNLHRTDEYIMKHNKYMTLSGDYKYNSWFNVLTNDEDVDAFDQIPGYSTKMRGYVAGIERKIKDQYAAGFALATTTQTVDSSENTDFSKIKGNQYYAYATWDQHKETRGYYAVASLGYGDLDFDTERQMGLVLEKTNSSHKAKAYTAALSAGCDYSTDYFITRSYASIKYAKLDEDAYAEKDTLGVGFSFSDVNSKSLEGALGVSITRKLSFKGVSFMPEIHVEYATELDNSVDSIYAEFETGDGFSTPVRELSKTTWTYGCSLSAKITENSMFNIAYDFIDYDSYNDEATKLSTAIQMRF